MKKTLNLILLISSLSIIFCATAFGLNTSFSWYCKRNPNHIQPKIDSDMNFIEKYSGYYVDKKYAESNDKVVYLTFDAGYENGNVEKILNILKNENVVGSFFVLENIINTHSDLIDRMIKEGHLVGNHTAHHKDISKLSYDELKKELETLEIKFKEKSGTEMPKYFRPPEGKFSIESMKFLEEMGYKTVFWSLAYADWDNNNQMSCDTALKKVMDNIHNGAIILLHPTSATNVKILPDIIKQLKAEGYSFKTVDNL